MSLVEVALVCQHDQERRIPCACVLQVYPNGSWFNNCSPLRPGESREENLMLTQDDEDVMCG